MGVSKVALADGRVLIDLTDDTVDEDSLVEGRSAHDNSGRLIFGALRPLTEEDVNSRILAYSEDISDGAY